MKILPELIKSLGSDGLIIGVVLLILAGVAGVLSYSHFTLKLIDKLLRESNRQSRERQDAYERGRRDADDHRPARRERTPPEGTRAR